MFKYETPPWLAKLICFVYLVFSCLFFVTFSTYDNWAGNSPDIFKYLFIILALVFSLPALKFRNWRGWVYFTADNQGLNFPTTFDHASNINSFNVAWENVGAIKSEILYGNVRGVSIELNISKTDIDLYFRQYALAKKILGINHKRGCYFVVAYGNKSFQKISDVVTTLNDIKRTNI
jgi:hypothetical protein